MSDTRVCANCGSSFEANRWSAKEYCDDCVKNAVLTTEPSSQEAGQADDAERVRDWVVPASSRDKRGEGEPFPRREAGKGLASPGEEAEEVSVEEEEVPFSEAGQIIGDAAGEARGSLWAKNWPALLLRDFGFWIVLAMGVMPLFIGGISDPVIRLTGLLFFFALLWGAVFQGMVLRSHASLVSPFLAFFFTGVVGLFLLYTLYTLVPASYLSMALSDKPLTLLCGQIFQVGLCEEACKLIPVVGYLAIKGRRASATAAILVGVYSGLGFAAFENIQYSQAMITSAAQNVYHTGNYVGHAAAAFVGEEGAYQVIGALLLRVFSLVFLHAVFSGIAASLLIAGGRGRIASAVAVPAFLHGLYNWLSGVSTIPAGMVIAASFFFFCANLNKAGSSAFGNAEREQ